MDEEKENVDPDFKDFQPLKRKRKGTVSPTKRFKASTRENEIDTITKGYVPDNTKRSTSWAVNVFKEWKAARKYEDGDKKCPDNLFDIATSDELNYWLPRFVNEVRKADGLPYPPRSIQLILAVLVSDACNSTGKFYGTTATGVLGGINSCSIGNLTINMQGPLNT